MSKQEKTMITVETTVNVPIETAWKVFTSPEHITQWNFASPEWHSPTAENDLRTGGKFVYRMEAKDGSFGFDFGGVYDQVESNKLITYTMGDGRTATITFTGNGSETKVVETFEAESTNSVELQRSGWQAILDNYRRHAESVEV